MTTTTNAVETPATGCGCGYNEDLGEHLLCPEGARLLAERDKAYRRLALFEDYERAREKYRMHIIKASNG